MGNFKTLFHVSLHVKDAKKSVEFYEKVGLEHMFDMSTEGEGSEPWVVYMRIAHGQYLEIQSVNAKTPDGIPDTDGIVNYNMSQSIWHFALETEDLASLIDSLWANGITVWTGPDATQKIMNMEEALYGDDGCRIAWIIDPDGTPIELMEQVGQTKQQQYDPE